MTRLLVICLALAAALGTVEAGLRIPRYPVRTWVGMSDPVHHLHPPDVVCLVGDHQAANALRQSLPGIFDS